MFLLLLFLLLPLILLAIHHLYSNYHALPASLPGPLLSHLTSFHRFSLQRRGLLRSHLLTLHSLHGPIIRYGPRSISLSLPSAINPIYNSQPALPTAASYRVLLGIKDGVEIPSLVSTRDPIRHGQLRRSVASAFTEKGSLEYEVFVDATIPDLVSSLRRSISLGQKINLPDLLMLYAMDSASRMAFSESLGCLRSGEDVGGSIAMIRDRLRHWGHWSGMPWAERLVYRNWWAMRRSKGRTPGEMVRRAAEKLGARLEKEAEGETGDILGKFIAAHRANPQLIDPQGVVGLLMSTLSGAGDTSATTMSALLLYVVSTPGCLAKLRNELQAAGLSKEEIPRYAQTARLPYLAAVLKESMRMFPVVTWPLEREVQEGGMMLAGNFIPAGTSVGIFVPALHRDKEVFGEDADVFRPERWLDTGKDGDGEKIKKMEQASMGFSRGRRVCLGQHVAVMQMKKVIPVLILGFDLELVDKKAWLDADMSGMVPVLKPLWVVAKEMV
jgi:cytochrome P450